MAVKLARLPVNWEKQPELVRRYWDTTMSEIEKTLNAILAIPIIQEALEGLDAAVAAAQQAAKDAQDAADSASGAANTARLETSLTSSYVANFTAPLISADSTGQVTIAAHDRVYGDPTLNPTRAIAGGTISTAASASSVIRVYYNDPTRAGGAVTYLFTVDPAPPPVQSGDTHSIGAVIIPAAGTQDGNFIKPPGFVEP